MRLARLRPPWRLQLGRPGPLAGCVLLLCAAAGATALTPLPGYGCPAAASSLARTSAPHPGGTAPVIAAAVLAADAGAVSDAQAAVDKHDAAVQAARSSAAAAESLGASASGARTKAQAGSYSPDTSVDVTMAQSTVDSDTSSLASDKEQVTFYQGLVDAS